MTDIMKDPAVSESTTSSTIPVVDGESGRKQQQASKQQQLAAVSFRDDVVFAVVDSNVGSSGRSGISISSSTHSYSKFRSSLTREQTNRDPFYFYEITRNLGTGSMGDVKLVKKRPDKVGGSARRDIQQAVKRQKQQEDCLKIPVVGTIFQFCLDADLKDEQQHVSNNSSRHSFVSLLAKDDSSSTAATSRSFEDSLLKDQCSSSNSSSEIIYAMKSILLSQVTQPEFIEELRNEIAILKDLDHPNIVRAIETFEFRGKISIVMELCSGGDLYARDPYTEFEAARIVSSILSAIAYMHSRKIVHRDLKFENVLFVNTSPMSPVKLIDFGLSRVYAAGDQKLTDISGTIYTMAPEVIRGQHTEKADVWSIGVITYMLLASAIPVYGSSRQVIAKKILENKYSFQNRRFRKVSPEAKEFITTLLVSDPDERVTAQSALGSAWLSANTTSSSTSLVRAEEEELAKSSMLKYARYPKLKKMALMVVAHKSSSDEIGILRKLFEKYASHDGSIGFEEFRDAMSSSGHSEEDLRSVFDAMDLSGSGRIRYTEFIAATIEAHGTISEARLAEAFDRLDCDDSGYITPSDLMEILGEDVSRDEIDEIIAEADLTKDNSVSYSEFMALWEDSQQGLVINEGNRKVLESELSSISVGSETEGSDARAEFLKEKHLQNTLHTWALEMQLPAHEFARGCSFLHQVALGNWSDLEKILEERPALANFRDYDRRTALHIAASEGLVDICQLLINKGARVNRSDRWGGFPLDDAHRHRHADVVNLLREHGAKFGSTSQTVNLITAASEGNVEEVKTLLEFGSGMDLNQGDYDHRTALHLAANEGHLDVVKLLVKAGADVNVKDRWGEQPLDDARKAEKNSAAIVKILSAGAIADTPSNDQHQAARMHDLKDRSAKQATGSLLDEHKDEGMTQLSVQEFAMGCSLLHQAALGNQLVLEKILMERPALVGFRDYDRRTALHIAASEGQVGICRYLVQKGAKINRVDRWGGSPLDDAHRHRNVEVVKLLRDQGAKFGSTSQVTNFITAASEGDVEEVQAFLDFGSVDINQGDYDRRTALHLAAGEGHFEIVRMLCEAGADVNVEDRWGHRPLDEAKKSADIMKLLLQHGAKSSNIITMIATSFWSLFKK